MSIVINGSGTISGISVGGLPDSIVDAGTLATNSVTNAKITDGSVDAAALATNSVTAEKLEVSAITHSDLPSGSVLQVVHGNTNSNFSIGGATYADTGLSAAITPKFSNSKIYIQIGQPGWISVDTTAARHVNFNICRGSTVLIEGKVVYKAASGYDTPFSNNLNWLDSPNTTSATTYKTQMKINNSAADAYAQQDSDSYSTITLMEIAG